MDWISIFILLWFILGFVSAVLELYITKDIKEYVSIPYFLLCVLSGPIELILMIFDIIPKTVKNPFYKEFKNEN